MDKEQKLREKKKLIIEALKRLLEKNVYSQISVEDVAKEAGLSKGGLRHYFPTKEELYVELIEDFFNQIEKDNIGIIKGLDHVDRAFISTLFGIERFLLDKKNIRIFINIILYGFEDEKIMAMIRKFLRNHLNMYDNIIHNARSDGSASSPEETQFVGRITQIILLCAGLFESIDPIRMDTPELIEYILRLHRMKPETARS
jgi:AcrR family transcriptional regulator